MKLAIASILAATAAAFAPSQVGKSSTALGAYENELGVLAPTGFFDPLKLSAKASPETFAQYRAAELKHGRVAQLAVLGYIAPETYRFGYEFKTGLSCEDIPNGLAAINAIPALGWLQIIALIGAVELKGVLRFDIGEIDLPEEVSQERQLQELQHGRLAMLAIAELVRHDLTSDGNLIVGLPWLYN